MSVRWPSKVWAAVAAAAAVTAAALAISHDPAPPPAAASVTPPWQYTTSSWDSALGSDAALTEASYRALTSWSDPALSAQDQTQLRELATAVTDADLTATGRARWPTYWPPAPATGRAAPARCESVSSLAASPAALPVSRPGTGAYAKVLVASSATCGSERYTRTDPRIDYVYATRSGSRWTPVREHAVPAQDPDARTPAQAAIEPAPWQLKEFARCAGAQVLRDRIVVVDAFEQMCAAAADAGVELTLESAYRTRGEQAELFAAAVRSYGSEAEARRWVAYADAQLCTSRHCSGLALNVTPGSEAMRWLTATVGCSSGSGLRADTACARGERSVPRMARWGFSAPVAAIPGYLEFTLPVPDDGAAGSLSAPDCAPAGIPVANMVAAIFRCRLDRAGVTGTEQDTVVAQALTVARCESGWNASARAYAGRYLSAPNPADGRTYTHAGVFMIDAERAAGWVPGGAAKLLDPVANINGAASLWLATRGWEQFGCATGTVGGFEAGPVLPQFGGPKLPAWASQY